MEMIMVKFNGFEVKVPKANADKQGIKHGDVITSQALLERLTGVQRRKN